MSAVKTLKNKNVLHRDIKDENILVNLKTNNCILIDFGSGTHFEPGILREFEVLMIVEDNKAKIRRKSNI